MPQPVYRSGDTESMLLLNELSTLRNQLALLSSGSDVYFPDSKRNVALECGYVPTEKVNVHSYRTLYDREPIPARVVDLEPSESWQVSPEVFETPEPDNTTPFEQAWIDLAEELQEFGPYESEKGHPVWEYLERLDKVSGIGHYGTLLIGIDDGLEMTQPAIINPENADKKQQLLYLVPLDESVCQIANIETDLTNPRYGMPTTYHIKLAPPVGSHALHSDSRTITVHWTRVLHVADNLVNGEVYGTPRMKKVYNRLYDLHKLYGGSAEMYWQGAFFGLSFETHPNAPTKALTEVEKAQMRDQIAAYRSGLQRYLTSRGQTVKSLSPQVADPASWIDKQLEAICIEKQVPKRVFMGSERGELASSQDMKSWSKRMRKRQEKYLVPRIIVPFINRLIGLGVLPRPERYFLRWPDIEEQAPLEKAQLAATITEALSKYVTSGADQLIEPFQYLTKVIGLEEELVEEIIEDTDEYTEEVKDEQMAEQKELMKEAAKNDLPAGNNPPNGVPPTGSGQGQAPRPAPKAVSGAGPNRK